MDRFAFGLFALMFALPVGAFPATASETEKKAPTIQKQDIVESSGDGRYILTTPTHKASPDQTTQTQKNKENATGDPDRQIIVGSPQNPAASVRDFVLPRRSEWVE